MSASDGSKPLAAKREAFCQAYAAQKPNAKNASAAYRASRNCDKMQTATINSNAKKLLRETPVRLRIKAIELERECSPDVQVAENVPQDSGLKLEEEKFCQHYVLNGNATAAFGQAFPHSRKWQAASRQNKASTLLNKDRVQARIKVLRAKVLQAAEKSFDITKDAVLQEYAKMGFSNMLDYMTVGPDGTAHCDLTKLTRTQAAAIQEVTFDTIMSSEPEALDAAGVYDDSDGGEPKKKVAVLRTKFKLHDKKGPLDSIGKHLGLFAVDNAQKGQAAGEAIGKAIEAMTETERARRVAFMLTKASKAPADDKAAKS